MIVIRWNKIYSEYDNQKGTGITILRLDEVDVRRIAFNNKESI